MAKIYEAKVTKEVVKKAIIQVLKQRNVPVKEIVMFGSRARGDFKSSSDWDFLIVLRETISRDQKREIAHRIRKKLAELYIPCDVIVKSQKEVQERKEVIGSVIRSAIKEGIIL